MLQGEQKWTRMHRLEADFFASGSGSKASSQTGFTPTFVSKLASLFVKGVGIGRLDWHFAPGWHV